MQGIIVNTPPPSPHWDTLPVHVISSSFCSCNFQQKTNEMVQLKRKVTAPCALLWYKFQNISFFVVHAIQRYKINICCCLRVIFFYSELYISTINLILFALGLLLFLKRYASRRTIWIVGKGGVIPSNVHF